MSFDTFKTAAEAALLCFPPKYAPGSAAHAYLVSNIGWDPEDVEDPAAELLHFKEAFGLVHEASWAQDSAITVALWGLYTAIASVGPAPHSKAVARIAFAALLTEGVLLEPAPQAIARLSFVSAFS